MKRLLTCRILRPVCNVKEFKSHSQRRRQLRLLGSATELSIMQLSLRPSAFKRLALLLPSFFLSFASAAQTVPVDVTIDGSKTGAPISNYIYGQFLEHGGNIVNEGVWAEMLEDRKFYYPVTSKPPAEPPVPAWRRRGPLRHWTPVGGDEIIAMDTDHPYTGDHTPCIKLDGKDPRGFAQSGLAVRNGKAYTGRIVLSGSPGAMVKVALIWGTEPGDRQTVMIRVVGSEYRRSPLRFQNHVIPFFSKNLCFQAGCQ
jgi:alpha-N-arabinofuranosidase